MLCSRAHSQHFRGMDPMPTSLTYSQVSESAVHFEWILMCRHPCGALNLSRSLSLLDSRRVRLRGGTQPSPLTLPVASSP